MRCTICASSLWKSVWKAAFCGQTAVNCTASWWACGQQRVLITALLDRVTLTPLTRYRFREAGLPASRSAQSRCAAPSQPLSIEAAAIVPTTSGSPQPPMHTRCRSSHRSRARLDGSPFGGHATRSPRHHRTSHPLNREQQWTVSGGAAAMPLIHVPLRFCDH